MYRAPDLCPIRTTTARLRPRRGQYRLESRCGRHRLALQFLLLLLARRLIAAPQDEQPCHEVPEHLEHSDGHRQDKCLTDSDAVTARQFDGEELHYARAL